MSFYGSRHQNLRVICISVLLAGALAGGASGSENAVRGAGEEGVARVAIHSVDISWQPLVDYASATLSVSGPGAAVIRREFAAGMPIVLDLTDEDVAVLGDGLYIYELVLGPRIDGGTAEALQRARETGDETIVEELKQQGKLPETAMVKSGSFRVENGAILAPRAETAIAKDIVHADDVDVQGGLCAGVDCVDGENFNFITLKLKENNTRLLFDDTSAIVGFPANDWTFVANDTAAGGANYMAIQDTTSGRQVFRVSAGAPANSLFVGSGGDLGIRTSTPVLDVHAASGDTPGLRLEQNTSGGYAAQTWDVAGNETSFFVRDASNGSTLPFRIRPGAPSSSIDIAGNGNVGFGTPTPNGKLHIAGAGSSDLKLVLEGSGGTQVEGTFFDGSTRSGRLIAALGNSAGSRYFGFISYADKDGNLLPIRFFTPDGGGAVQTALYLGANQAPGTGGFVGVGRSDPSFPLHMASGAHVTVGGVWTNASSRDYKDNIANLSLDAALDAVMGLQPVTFDYKNTGGEHHVGFIAEDVPALVAEENRKSLSPMDIVAVLTKVVQEQNREIADQRQTIRELAVRVAVLEGR